MTEWRLSKYGANTSPLSWQTEPRDHPEIILPELANLMGTNESGMTYAESDPPIFVKPYVIHREEAATLLGDVLNGVLDCLCEI